MRIGVIWPENYPLARTTVRFELYLEGFRALGHDAVLVATEAASVGFPCETWKIPDRAALLAPGLWADLGLDAALVCTWLVNGDVLAAARPHVRRLISLSDSDGCIGVRVHPWSLLSRMWVMQQRLPDRLRTARWWLSQFLGIDVRRDAEVLASCRLADRIVVFSPGAGESLASFFRYHREEGLIGRIAVAPYPVDEGFGDGPLEKAREDRVVAIGRWDDPQKDAGLLAASLKRLLRDRAATRCSILGAGGGGALESLRAAFPGRVDCPGPVPPARVREILGRSRCLVSTSRWESGPIVAAEALLRGCSLVGPHSIPSFRCFCRDGSCGTTFVRRSAPSASAAVRSELEAWDAGRRDAEEIGSAWRGHFTPRAVCRRLLAGLSADAGDAGPATPGPAVHAFEPEPR